MGSTNRAGLSSVNGGRCVPYGSAYRSRGSSSSSSHVRLASEFRCEFRCLPKGRTVQQRAARARPAADDVQGAPPAQPTGRRGRAKRWRRRSQQGGTRWGLRLSPLRTRRGGPLRLAATVQAPFHAHGLRRQPGRIRASGAGWLPTPAPNPQAFHPARSIPRSRQLHAVCAGQCYRY
jgi:hypothetical protein